MIEDFSDDFGILDGGQDPHAALPSRAKANVLKRERSLVGLSLSSNEGLFGVKENDTQERNSSLSTEEDFFGFLKYNGFKMRLSIWNSSLSFFCSFSLPETMGAVQSQMMNSLRSSFIFQFILPLTLVVLSFTGKIVFAEMLDCRQSLSAQPYLASLGAESNLRDQNLAKGMAAFLNLLDTLLEEVGKSETDSLENQLRLLNFISQSATPIKKLEMFSTEKSHFLTLLRNGDTLGKLASSISLEQWKQIQHFANEKRNELLRITDQHEAKAAEGKPDFIDIPDINGRVRLHHLLETRQYKKAIALLENPRITTRYINTRDNNGNTPLDFFEYPDLGGVTTKSSTSIERLARTYMPSEGQAVLKVAEILYEKSAMTGQQLHLFELGFLEAPLPKPYEEINLGILNISAQGDQTQDNLTRYYEIGGNLNAVSGDGESLASLFVKAGRLDRLKKLKSLGGKFDIRNFDGETLVHQAARYGTWQLIPFLVENGVDINAVDSFGKSAIFKLDNFNNRNKLATARMLEDLGINPDILDHTGWSAAHYFSRTSSVALQSLASIGANLEIQNGAGATPLMLTMDEHLFFQRDFPQSILTVFAEYFISRGIDPESRGLYKSKTNPPAYLKEEDK